MKKAILSFLIASVFFISHLSFSQYQNIMISNQYNCGETSIAINPLNTNQMVAGANIFYNGYYRCGYYFTTNAGLNWTLGILDSDSGKPYCDPGVAADMLGNFFYTADAQWVFNSPPYLAKLYCMKSTNGGVNWMTGVFAQCAPKMADMPTMCVDLSNSIYQNNIYVVYSLADTFHSANSHNDSSYAYFCRSTNHGVTFSTPKRISKQAGIGIGFFNSYLEGCVCCAGPEGEVYAAWVDSTGLIFDRSTDGGVTWLDSNIFVSPVVGGWSSTGYACSYTGTPWIDCDVSNGPYKGTIYLSWTDNRSGLNRKDIWFVKSTDKGNYWSQPIRVNDDPVNISYKVHFFSHLVVDQVNGNLYCAFYDNRNYPNTNLDLYLARSTNGGVSFVNIKVNSNPFSLCNVYTGDYIGLAARNNKVRPVWTEGINNVNSIWTAIIDTFMIGIRPISNEIPERFELLQNYPNPFNPTTKIKFDIPNIAPPFTKGGQGGLTTLKIYNILGRELATPVNENLAPGTYEVEWNAANFASGVYFYKLQAGDFEQTRKMILLK